MSENKANRVKTLALVDWNWQGHHPTYFNHFVLALEELGVNLLALCPHPDDAEATANSTRRPSIAGTASGMTTFGEIREAASRRFQSLRPARISAIDWTIRNFRGIENQVSEWTGESGQKVDAIFYACVYNWDFHWINVAQPFLRFPWLGLYLHAMSYRMPGHLDPITRRVPCPEKMFGGNRCKGIGILDEGIQDRVAKSIGKPLVVMPDLTDERVAVNESGQILKGHLQQFSAGRRIVGLFGHLQKSKGILTFLEAARNSVGSDLCFALGGDIIWPTDLVEAERIQMALVECPNIWTHFARIPDGKHMNSLLECCDVLFAGYWDFPHSSNIMTKAALLKKPVIVSDGYLMAERVRCFKMGEVIPQGNAHALLEAILKVTNDPTAWISRNNPNWSEYLSKHSFEQLKTGLAELLASV